MRLGNPSWLCPFSLKGATGRFLVNSNEFFVSFSSWTHDIGFQVK